VAKKMRTRPVSADQVRAYAHQANEYADAVCGARLGERSAGEDHDQALTLLKQAGRDGASVEKDLRRLLPLKTKAEYEPDDVAAGVATKAVDRPQRAVAIAQAVAARSN
jgi:hypothetical protein